MLTNDAINKLRAPAKGYTLKSDGKTPGFGVRVTAAGTKSFVLSYRTKKGRPRRYTIGAYPEWKVTAARAEAKRLWREIDGGADPVGENQSDRDAPTVRELAERYLKEHAHKKRTASDDERIFRADGMVMKALGSKKVTDVDYTDIDRLHRRITDAGKPYRANRVVATLSKAFSLAIKWKMRPERDNPCKGVERNQEAKRKRYLSGDELQRLLTALDFYSVEGGPTGRMIERMEAANAIRLLLLTGARRGEVLSATWDQFDIENGVWIKPGATTKQKTEHRVPLSAAARGVLEEIYERRRSVKYLFPSEGALHRIELKKPWAAICHAASIKNLRLHDLRHSYASILASAGHSLPTIGALLGHTRPETTARYAHLFDENLRKATDTVGTIVMGQPSTKETAPKGRVH